MSTILIGLVMAYCSNAFQEVEGRYTSRADPKFIGQKMLVLEEDHAEELRTSQNVNLSYYTHLIRIVSKDLLNEALATITLSAMKRFAMRSAEVPITARINYNIYYFNQPLGFMLS
ncbi:hypothetical protein P154DRAFT_540502 [Amniculicola lignicola CBS 123094]|uniref:Uncharacterized protein n=1 Tax=Amniculicola lignicola CBS 123094 TaxID=1392246 RepID=A0A6A5VXF1_9PLEO|nr:hypothetical protein P154DRAFT_540502 [Amniculicola lignicola CBS 123094]